MRFGVYVPNFGQYGDPKVLRDLAVAAEAEGWDGFFLWDLIGPYDYEPPVADPWIALSAVAQATESIALGPMVVPLPRRRPWKLAAEASTLQSLSDGRLILGLGTGAGWDYARYGESDRRAELAARLDEGADLLHRLPSGAPVEHEGRYYRVTGARFPRAEIPIWTSGFWPRTKPVRGARGAVGLFPQIRDPEHDFRLPTPDEVRQIRADFAAAGGRAEGDVVIWSPTEEPDVERVAAYEAAGVTWWLSDGSEITPDALHRRIAAGPPR